MNKFNNKVLPDGARWDVLQPPERWPVGQEVEGIAKEQRLRVGNGFNLK